MSEKTKVPETVTVKGAIIVPPQLAEKIMSLFGEMPRKFSSVIDPIIQEFMSCSQADVVLNPKEQQEEKPKEEKK